METQVGNLAQIAAISWPQIGWGLLFFFVTFVLSLLAVGAILIWIPANFFLDSHNRDLWIDHHPAVRWAGLILKNAVGVCLVAIGAFLSLPGIPGQGLLTILIGLLLIDFPGKRKLERKIVKRPGIRRRINALRRRFGKPAFVLEEPHSV